MKTVKTVPMEAIAEAVDEVATALEATMRGLKPFQLQGLCKAVDVKRTNSVRVTSKRNES
jgi:hypothetical protein